MSDNVSIFKPGKNCWRTGTADHAAILIDSSNYYGALYEAICRAQRSIFVLGWDIDSRIKLKRGEEAEGSGEPVTFFNLICTKARENPDLQIYLNRWDYSLFFMSQREPFWIRKWKRCGLKNIHVCLDGVIPIAACHHQKIVVIDDEVAFWGGMDVALGRWDWRQHHVHNLYRADPSGLPDPKKKMKYGPYHDIQAVIAGPIVADYARLVRDRWRRASTIKPLPLSHESYTGKNLPQSWPESFPPQFRNIPVALARTLPPILGHKAVHEGLAMFVDVIAQAENFIYIENQYLACEEIAEALNRQLLEKPGLRLLAVSCDRPQGTMERKSMWGGRVRFGDILKKGAVADRIELVYPASKEGKTEKSIHIHSKMLIIDDKYLHLGSSNIANRSMGMDTEFDVTLVGATPESRKKIASIRNDLIREHCGREIREIQHVIDNGLPVGIFAEELKTSRQHLRRLDDTPYRKERFVDLARSVGDPKQPIIPMSFTHILHRRKESRFAPPVTAFLAILAVIAVLILGWAHLPTSHYGSMEQAIAFLKRLSSSPWAMLYATGLYALGSTVFFPLTAMTGASVAVFGPLKGITISFTGSLIGSLVGFSIGRLIGLQRLERLFGPKTSVVMNKIKDTGIVTVTLIRLLPIAPYPLVNMVFGVAGISLNNYIIGTVLGLIPGKIALAVAGDGIFKAFRHPDPKSLTYLLGGLLLWLAIMMATQKIARHFQKRTERSA
jgi:phospholipase D1/2